MSNRLYKYLIENKILYFKQLGFQNSHSTDHAIVQLVDQICKSFNNIKYTLGVFSNPFIPNAFFLYVFRGLRKGALGTKGLTFQRIDTVDHPALIWYDGQILAKSYF